jgi:hypothetical protein
MPLDQQYYDGMPDYPFMGTAYASYQRSETHHTRCPMNHRELSPVEIDAALRQAEAIRSAYIAGACKSMVARIREGLGHRAAAQHGLTSA